MVDWHLRFYATGTSGNRTLKTSLVGGGTSVFTQDLVPLYGGTGFTKAQCNAEAKRLVPRWNNTGYWSVITDSSSDLGTPTEGLLQLLKSDAKKFDGFMPVSQKLNNKFVGAGNPAFLGVGTTFPIKRVVHLNDFSNRKLTYLGKKPKG